MEFKGREGINENYIIDKILLIFWLIYLYLTGEAKYIHSQPSQQLSSPEESTSSIPGTQTPYYHQQKLQQFYSKNTKVRESFHFI